MLLVMLPCSSVESEIEVDGYVEFCCCYFLCWNRSVSLCWCLSEGFLL